MDGKIAMKEYDVIIIGGGPAGYLAAERLGHEGKKVLLVEKEYLGGTCLNWGCIPTKTLLNSAKHYLHAKEGAHFGIKIEGLSYDFKVMMAWKDEVVTKLRAGIAGQMKRFGVEVIAGTASILAPGKVQVSATDSAASGEYGTKAILICTGSSPAMPPILGSKDNKSVVDSTGLLAISAVPKRLTVIGGGVIGVEFASLFAALGSKVAVVEMMDEIVPFMDKDQAPLLRKALSGVEFKLGCKVEKLEGATVHYTTKAGLAEKVEADLVLMAVGRRPNLQGWGAQEIGLDTSPKGVNVDERMRTNLPGIWAAGDITGKSQLAHSAYRMAEVAVSDMVAKLDGKALSKDLMRFDAIPWAVYSIPEAAGVGMTEQEAASRGIAIKKGSLPLKVSGRFVAENTFSGPGAVKIISDAVSGRVLGVHAVGAYSSEFIWGGAALIEQEMCISDVKQLVFPHPTVGEVIREASWLI